MFIVICARQHSSLWKKSLSPSFLLHPILITYRLLKPSISHIIHNAIECAVTILLLNVRDKISCFFTLYRVIMVSFCHSTLSSQARNSLTKMLHDKPVQNHIIFLYIPCHVVCKSLRYFIYLKS